MGNYIKKENDKTLKAFEFYYALSGGRSLTKIAETFKISLKTAKEWSRCFSWQERVYKRDLEIAKEIEKRNKIQAVQDREKYASTLENNIKILQQIKRNIFKKDKNNNIITDGNGVPQLVVGNLSIGDLNAILGTEISQMKSRLFLMGDATDRIETTETKSIMDLMKAASIEIDKENEHD